MYKLPLRPTPVGIESLQGLPLLGVPGTQALPLRIRGPTRAYARLRARADSCPVRMAPASIAALEEELRALDLEALRERADSEGGTPHTCRQLSPSGLRRLRRTPPPTGRRSVPVAHAEQVRGVHPPVDEPAGATKRTVLLMGADGGRGLD